jgi:hypothetical protein
MVVVVLILVEEFPARILWIHPKGEKFRGLRAQSVPILPC